MEKLLLYSTGLDSELYRLLENPEGLLFFKSGARYESWEVRQLEKFIKELKLKEHHKIFIDDTLNFSSIEKSNAIVPMRNIFYFLRAFEYCENILIGVTYYDLHYDKQPDVIGSLISFVQSYYYFRNLPESWEGCMPTIQTPYRDLTKGELLGEAIKRGCDVSHIPTLRTCYDADSEKGCGKCKSCVAKAIALAVNGMFDRRYFDKDPRIEGKKWIKFYKKECAGTIDENVFLREVNILMDS